MRRFKAAVVLLALGLMLGAAGMVHAADPTFLPQPSDGTGLPSLHMPASPGDDSQTVIQYGDPDDAITGNRGPSMLGGLTGAGESDSLPLRWRVLEIVQQVTLGLVPVVPAR